MKECDINVAEFLKTNVRSAPDICFIFNTPVIPLAVSHRDKQSSQNKFVCCISAAQCATSLCNLHVQ